MSNDLQPASVQNPFGRIAMVSGGMNVGAVAIEQERAIAEAQGKLVLAKRFPRDTAIARREIMEACKDYALAEVAFYSLPRGGESIEGPTIKLAEELARCWGNIDYGHRELSRSDGKSEIEVYAWDTQTNTTSTRQLTVRHVIDLKGGKSRPCNSEKEIDDLVARKASSQLRGRILAVLPKYLVQAAIQLCQRTLEGGNGISLSARIDRMVSAFAKIGVDDKMLSRRLGHPIGDTTAEELVELIGVFTSIKEGHFTVADQFPSGEDSNTEADPEKAGVQQLIKQQQEAAPSAAKQASKSSNTKSPGKSEVRQNAQAVENKVSEQADGQRVSLAKNEGNPAKEQTNEPPIHTASAEDISVDNDDKDVF